LIHLYYSLNKSKLTKNEFDNFEHQLPTGLLEDFQRFKRWQDKQASLLGKILLCHGLREAGFQSIPQIKYTQFKRPYLDLPVDFNISHSGDYVVCAISKNGSVGVDIEEIRPIEIEHFRSVFSTQELAEIKLGKNNFRNFYKYWTCKESLIKADGTGFYIESLNKLNVMSDMAVIKGRSWHIRNFEVDPSYCLAVAFDQMQDVVLDKLLVFDRHSFNPLNIG
jgi:4'-phosphopantetheinyl transferase